MAKRIMTVVLLMVALIACQESMEERAARDAREITEKKCPMPIGNDGTVILERVEFDIPTLTWKENLLLDFPEEAEMNMEEVKRLLIDELKNTPSYKAYRDNGYQFRYIYCRMSNPQDTLINITLTKKDYQ